MLQANTTLNGDIVTLGGINFRRKLRWYTINFVRSAVVSAIFQAFTLIDSNLAPFFCLSIHAGDTADGNALTSQEDWLIQIQDNENGYIWSDGYMPRTAFAGSREFGYNLPDPWAIRANTRVTFNLQNKAVAPAAGTATVTLRGWTLLPM